MPAPTASAPLDIHKVLRDTWGYEAFRPKQEDIVRAVLSGKDTLALLPTGGGKSLCFQVPAMAMGKLCLVVSPLIALMKDQVQRLHALGIPARAIVSTMNHAEIDNALESAALGKLAFLYVSPERLATDLFLARLPRLPLGLIAVDEAHCISQWGYDFRPAYQRIAEVRVLRPEVPVIALTASATPLVAKDIMEKLAFRAPNLIKGSFLRPELSLWVSHGEDKYGRLLKVLRNVPGTAIVYVRERRSTTRVAAFLSQQGISAAAYHAGLPAAERDRIQHLWTDGTLRCMVATNAFGMGIDKADVRVVVHMEPPADLESYYQEAGRAGRDGRPSFAFLLTGPGDERKLRERLAASFPSISEVRMVYQAFADMHRIAMGSGLMATYPVDIRALADRTKLPAVTVANALKALELDGRVALSDGVRTPSRVLFTATHGTIYTMRVGDSRNGPLIEALLRMYGGIHEEPVSIDEIRIAKAIEWQADTVIQRLKDLDRMKVLSFRPRSDSPSLTLLLPRIDAGRLVLDPTALAQRQQRAAERLDAMLHLLKDDSGCRVRTLLRYFGEEPKTDCGTCDRCRTKSSRSHGPAEDSTMTAEPLGPGDEDLRTTRWIVDGSGDLPGP
jgi:ATP-dependent DNA helicase RecQ